MRTMLGVAAMFAVAACGGSKAPPKLPASTAGPAAGPPAAERPIGTSGFPGLDWGDRDDKIKPMYPGAEDYETGTAWHGTVDGLPADVSFSIGNSTGLQQIDVAWKDTYPTMDACGEVLHRLKPIYEQRLGPSSEENLALFWDTGKASVTLACNPDDAMHGSLSASYQQQRPPE
ncbi:MAG TPA: hypothetical protein VHE35_28345 [Kofleriaceae bacterium]|nr:hypothetical protein [Kofleriaceae bacterium]